MTAPGAKGAAGGPLLSVKDLTVKFAVGERQFELVREATFDIGPGEVVALVGESGSGKSITARALLGLLRRNRRMTVGGTALLAGRDLLHLPERQLRDVRGREVCMIFQDPVGALDPVVSIGSQVLEAVRRRRSGSRQEMRRRVVELLQSVGISDAKLRAKQFPHEISGGMCQRALIAIALAGDPELLIADEPTTALDVTVQAQVLELLKRLRDERGMSVLLITHDMGVAAQTADRVLVMYAGSLVSEGPTADVFARPCHPYTSGLITSVPRVDAARCRRLAAIPGSVPEAADRPTGCVFHPRCPLATERCTTEMPLARRMGSQLVACHHAEELRDEPGRCWEAGTQGVGALGPREERAGV